MSVPELKKVYLDNVVPELEEKTWVFQYSSGS